MAQSAQDEPKRAVPHEHGHEGTPHDPGHVVEPKILLGVFGALLVLTVVTVAVRYIDLGQANIWLALLIAVVKAGLVAMYFMHLRWDSPFNGIVLIASLFFVALFIGIAVLDSREYQPALDPPGGWNPPGGISQPTGVAPPSPSEGH